jgi:hypothetical protein
MTGLPLVAGRATLSVTPRLVSQTAALSLEQRHSIESFFASRPGRDEVQANREDSAFDTAGSMSEIVDTGMAPV